MKRKLNIIGILLFLFGLSLTIVSFSCDRYSDERAFNEKYMEIDSDENASEQFFELRNEYLSSKDDYFDYGITFVICALIILLLSVVASRGIRTPNKRWIIVSIGLLAAITTTMSYVIDLFIQMSRGSYPHWADSLGIPLSGAFGTLIVLLVWVGLNSIGLMKPFRTSVLISPMNIAKANRLYMVIAVLSLIIAIWTIASGLFLDIIPDLLWVYFYMSILLGRGHKKALEESTSHT